MPVDLSVTPDKNNFHPRFPGGGEPTWEIAYFFPPQGSWTEQDFLELEDYLGGGIRAELVNGCLKVLPMPTENHQDIILFLLTALKAFIEARSLGKVSFSGIRIRLKDGADPQFREPDIAFMKREHSQRRNNKFWEGADLVMEVVSGDSHDRERDYLEKKKAYAEAGMAEYWIVDPDEKHIQVYTLEGTSYRLHGDFQPGSMAGSVLLPGFAVAVGEALAGGEMV